MTGVPGCRNVVWRGDIMKKNLIKSFFIFFAVVLLPSWQLLPGENGLPFSPGEKLQYSIHAASFYVGRQIIEFEKTSQYGAVDVYKLIGHSKTSPFVSIFYRLDDKWLVFMEKESLLPLRVEKDMVEGKSKGYVTYTIDQDTGSVIIENVNNGTKKTVTADNIVLDLFSLIYYYRKNPALFDTLFTFDFLEAKNVQTVQFQNAGDAEILVPKISKINKVQAVKLQQVGGIGIEIYIGKDALRLPLKLIVPSKLPRKKRMIIEFNLEKYSPGKKQSDIPFMYKKLSF